MTEENVVSTPKALSKDDVIDILVQRYRDSLNALAYLSTGQAAEILEVSEATIKRWCDDDILKTIRTPGRHRKISAQSVADRLNLVRQASVSAEKAPQTSCSPARCSSKCEFCEVPEDGPQR